MENKKYELTDETMEYDGVTLHRIRAFRDFGNVKKGELGGWIEEEENLSQEGNCWIAGESKVFDDAQVYGNAQVFDNAMVFNNAQVFDNAVVYENAKVFNNARVYGCAEVLGNARVDERARVYGNAKVYDKANVGGSARVFSTASVYGWACVRGYAQCFDNAKVCCYVHDAVIKDAKITSQEDLYKYLEEQKNKSKTAGM